LQSKEINFEDRGIYPTFNPQLLKLVVINQKLLCLPSRQGNVSLDPQVTCVLLYKPKTSKLTHKYKSRLKMIGTYKHNELLVPRQNNQNSIFNWLNLATAGACTIKLFTAVIIAVS
jgi:hypothetical protein